MNAGGLEFWIWNQFSIFTGREVTPSPTINSPISLNWIVIEASAPGPTIPGFCKWPIPTTCGEFIENSLPSTITGTEKVPVNIGAPKGWRLLWTTKVILSYWLILLGVTGIVTSQLALWFPGSFTSIATGTDLVPYWTPETGSIQTSSIYTCSAVWI